MEYASALHGALFSETLTLGLGVLLGLVWSRRTGWGCGGIIAPGVLALQAAAPHRAGLTLLCGALLVPLLALLSRRLSLYGRERVGAAVLLALFLRIVLAPFAPPHWIGWVVPGLIAADSHRQGLILTLCGALSCSAATVFLLTLLRALGGAI